MKPRMIATIWFSDCQMFTLIMIFIVDIWYLEWRNVLFRYLFCFFCFDIRLHAVLLHVYFYLFNISTFYSIISFANPHENEWHFRIERKIQHVAKRNFPFSPAIPLTLNFDTQVQKKIRSIICSHSILEEASPRDLEIPAKTKGFFHHMISDSCVLYILFEALRGLFGFAVFCLCENLRFPFVRIVTKNVGAFIPRYWKCQFIIGILSYVWILAGFIRALSALLAYHHETIDEQRQSFIVWKIKNNRVAGISIIFDYFFIYFSIVF